MKLLCVKNKKEGMFGFNDSDFLTVGNTYFGQIIFDSNTNDVDFLFFDDNSHWSYADITLFKPIQESDEGS